MNRNLKSLGLSLLIFVLSLPLFAQNLATPEYPEGEDSGIPKYEDTRHDNPSFFRSLSPGLTASMYWPAEQKKIYGGGGVHYVLFSALGSRSNNVVGAMELTFDIQYFKELNTPGLTSDVFFTYVTGITFSFERFSGYSRDFLIPTYGLEVGGIFVNDLGHGVLLSPKLGLLVLHNEFLSLGIEGKASLNTVNLKDYLGLSSSLNFSMSF